MARHSASEVLESDIVITTPGLSADEIAAVTAVLAAALREQAANVTPRDEAAESAWMRTRRNLRSAPLRGPGAWRTLD